MMGKIITWVFLWAQILSLVLCQNLMSSAQSHQVTGMPPKLPQPPPAYMVDNTGNVFQAAPDRFIPQPDPFNASLPQTGFTDFQNDTTAHGRVGNAKAATSYWLANMAHGSVSRPQA